MGKTETSKYTSKEGYTNHDKLADRCSECGKYSLIDPCTDCFDVELHQMDLDFSTMEFESFLKRG